jgi:DNA polymerase
MMTENEAPPIGSLAAARRAAADCRRCPLYRNATQTVFGEGPARAEAMVVGEQPGDQEDREGRPFVGPAGRLFDEILADLGIDRRRLYITNAVKHFKFVPRGKRRLHQRPDGEEIRACKFWLDLERDLVQPGIVVALGATAARSLLGRANITIGKLRGAPITLEGGTLLFVTNHPSYLLRIPDTGDRRRERARFEADLILVREAMAHRKTHHGVHGSA